MQPSAGPALPHTRSRGVHWLTTAVALGAVVAAVALVEPADASPTAAAKPAAPPVHVPPPDPHAVTYPLTCAPGDAVDVISQAAVDMDGDGRPETVVVVRCHSDTGTPPSGVYVLASPKSGTGAPHIAQMLVDPREDRQISGFHVAGHAVKATVLGFSSDTTPRCCPDLRRDYTWEWRQGRYVAIPGPAPNSV
ncbi:hypothetical protein [Actinacidiphila guanduensis]|uniref:Secreted protein n=1 Tax=Actinacidiphila guanduensis TaxID=310781 RepID=A0A1H0LDM2_9ACTN|nr:hypothetical protein [Actinacidiphila guanduensis]SDO66298.1 hypothetical protein SAMN05216259_111176 [Actinacidiphila guanduensis]